MKVGAHVSIQQGFDRALEQARRLGANCMQIFPGSPRTWKIPSYPQVVIDHYLEEQSKANIVPVFFHAVYPINIASSQPNILYSSIHSLIDTLILADRMKINGTIVHVGSHTQESLDKGFAQIQKALTIIFEKTPPSQIIILENSAGGGDQIGKTPSQIGTIMKDSPQPSRLKVCIDTAHIFVSGYDLRLHTERKKLWDECESSFGLENIVAIHCNDSKAMYNSHKDRHENIGEGYIGQEAFREIVQHPILKNTAFIIETPGFEGTGPDMKNIDILKQLAQDKP